MTALALMVDQSDAQTSFNAAAHYKAGYRVAAFKTTQGATYGWTEGLARADAWRKLGGRVVWYHFAEAGSGTVQADYMLAHVGSHLGADDVLAIDCETIGAVHEVAKAWMSRVHDKQPGNKLLVYGGSSFLDSANIRPAYGAGLWLAEYPPDPSAPAPLVSLPSGWKECTAWQFRDDAEVPGFATGVDQSHLYGWLLPSGPTPTPKPAPKPKHVGHWQRILIRLKRLVKRYEKNGKKR